MKKNYTLKRELTFLMILTSVCTLLSVCAAVFYVFFSFFFQKTQEDIEYVLRYTSQQYEAHMQFIEDSVIAIRHNTVLDDFFQKEEYDLEEIEPQLSYSMELFSERNMVERQLPFVTGIYLFNNGNECIYEHYYATTLAAGREQKRKYENMQQEFKSTSDQYACLSDKDELNIFFRIYDENMREKGIGIVQISQSAVAKVLETVQLYHNGGWAVLDKNDQLLASEGAQELVKKLQTSENSWNGTKDLAGTKVIGYGNLLWIWSTYSDLSRVWEYFFYFEAHSFYRSCGPYCGTGNCISGCICYQLPFHQTGYQDDPKHTGFWKTGSECQNGRFLYSGIS